MKRSITLFSVILLKLSISPCTKRSKSEDVVLLCTTDVHCGAKDKLGYSAVEAYKKEMQKECEYVSLLDAGDFIQGDAADRFVLLGDRALDRSPSGLQDGVPWAERRLDRFQVVD